MKIALIVLGVIYLQIVFGKLTEENLPPLHKECLKELNFGAEVLLDNFHEDFTINEDVSDFNKVILCTYRKADLVNADDTLDDIKFHNFLVSKFMKMANITLDNPEEAATNAIDSCKDVRGTDQGDTLVKNYNCVVKYLKNL